MPLQIPEQRQKLNGLYEQLATIAAADGIIALRASELQRVHDAQVAFTAAQGRGRASSRRSSTVSSSGKSELARGVSRECGTRAESVRGRFCSSDSLWQALVAAGSDRLAFMLDANIARPASVF